MLGKGSDIALHPGDAPACRQLWTVIEAKRAQVYEAVQQAAGALGDVLTVHGAVVDRVIASNGSAAQKAALCDAAWLPYQRELEALGTACAATGVDLHAWFELFDKHHAALSEALPVQSPELVAAALGLRAFVMTYVGRAYVDSRDSGESGTTARLGLYADLFRNSATGMVIYRFEDRADLGSFRLMEANAAAASVSHPRVFELVGKTLRQTSPYVLDTEIPRHYAAAVERGEPRSWTITTDAKALAQKTYSARSFPLSGDYVGVSFEDITEQRRMEDEVRGHVAELERSNRELDDFAYAASHDLKGPLQDVKNLSTWICEDLGSALPPATARHVETMLDRLGRMERLLDDLLAYSRAGRDLAPAERFSIREVFDDVLALTPLPDGFRVTVQADVAPIRTPRSPLAQVLRNLVGNAVKHHDRMQGLIAIEAVESKKRIHISVRDDGPGIPPEFHERVFRIFQTLQPRDAVEGSGIGLAIVKKVIESHGGSVFIESTGRGTAVHFSWPKESRA